MRTLRRLYNMIFGSEDALDLRDALLDGAAMYQTSFRGEDGNSYPDDESEYMSDSEAMAELAMNRATMIVYEEILGENGQIASKDGIEFYRVKTMTANMVERMRREGLI